MIFDFFRRLFGLLDETSRKRPVDDTDNECITNTIIRAKKRCCECEGSRVGKIIYANENDDGEIKFLSDLHYSTVNSKDQLNKTSCTRRKFAEPYQQSRGTYCKNSTSQMNGKERKSNVFSTKTTGSSSCPDSKYSTLTTTNQLREKQEYSQLLQNFLPHKNHGIRSKIQDEPKRRIVPEVIDLEKNETPVKSVPAKSTEQVEEVFTSTPLRWYTPPEAKSNEPFRSKFKNDATASSLRRSFGEREKSDGISVLKVKTSNTTMGNLMPSRNRLSLDLPECSKTAPSSSKTPAEKSNASFSQAPIRNCVEVIPTNTLRDNLTAKAVIKHDYVPKICGHYKERLEKCMKEAEEVECRARILAKHNRIARQLALEEQLVRSMRLSEPVLDETADLEEEALPELTPQMLQEIKQALIPSPPNEVLVESFGLRITRKDIHTLADLNWLNDEVINFYMNLLIVRGTNSEKYPKVHAMNTFFYPKLLSGGHVSLKRWTRKIDIFAQDIVVVPIHLGIHWCMSIIDFRDKRILYFDSMGASNPKCLSALRQYLEDESMDKKKQRFDTSDWKLESMKDIPQQMNGSDCGVFSCMFAEFTTANRKITFTQKDMPYFRNKMVYEILKAKLL